MHIAIMSALEDGSLSRDRLENAAKRVVYEKILCSLVQ
jgi:hypothetical protein